MITNVLNMMTAVFNPAAAAPSQVLPKTVIENPFASPFVNSQNKQQDFGWKNQPVMGGYFAGYYNGKPNIVGKRLFVSV